MRCLPPVWEHLCCSMQMQVRLHAPLQGVCFTVLHRTKQGLGVDCVRGNGFCIVRKPQKALTPRKTFMHWASVDTFRPGLSVLDAGLPRKVGPCSSLLRTCCHAIMLLICMSRSASLAEPAAACTWPGEVNLTALVA